MKKFKKPLIIGGIVIVVLGGLYFLTASKQNKTTYTTVALTKGNLVQTVSEVGTVKAQKELELNFLAAGNIATINVKNGDLVKKGQVLAELDDSALKIKEQGAQSDLAVATANLNKLLAGATAADINVAAAQNSQAQAAYLAATDSYSKTKNTVNENISQAQKSLNDLQSTDQNDVTPQKQAVITAQLNLNNTQDTYQQAINNNKNNLLNSLSSGIATANTGLDYVNRILTDASIKDVLSIKNTTYLANTQSDYAAALPLKDAANNTLQTAQNNNTDANLSAAFTGASQYLNQAYKTLTDCFSVLESTVTSASLSQSSLDSLKTNINNDITATSAGVSSSQTADYNYNNSVLSYKNNVASAQDALTQAQVNLNEAIKTATNVLASAKTGGDQQLSAAQSQVDATRQAWDVAQKQLLKIKTAARPEDIALSQAQVAQAQASLNLIKQQESDNQIIAPLDGQISNVNYEIGEQVNATKPAITMLTQNNFEVDADISESDIAKVKINDPAVITFDAFGPGQEFGGTVYFIDPAATVIQDVIYYNVKIKFTDDAQKLLAVKDGMTANVTMTTNSKNDVFSVPSRAIVEKNGNEKFIRLLVNNQVNEVPVLVGLSGNEGMVEVSSPQIKAGDQVITFTKIGN